MTRPVASVVVLVHAGQERLDDAVASLEPASRRGVEVIVVDNGSRQRVADTAERRFPWARVVRSEANLGFSGGVQLGADVATGDVLILLNDDAAAQPGFVDGHLEVLAAHPEAAATAGRLVNWDATRHDFVRGRVTFDAHAFQIGQGVPLEAAAGPEVGEPLPFACGGNMAIRRRDWDRAGGFDADLFAYYEDVELGWRLLAMGREVVAAPDAVARHRGSATSAALGDYRRGVLFERNALRVFFACADRDCRAAFGPAVLVTFLHRLAAFARADASLAWWLADPFGDGSQPPGWSERWRRRLRERGPLGVLRHAVARLAAGRQAGHPSLDDGLLVMQLRATSGFAAGLERTASRRASLEAARAVSDRELQRRFPRLVVPTYTGDRELFGSTFFQDLLPEDWPVDLASLEEVLDSSLLGHGGD